MSEVLEEKMESHGLQGHKEFTLKSSVKAFNILSDSLYMNKALAVIRELSTNARDAHISAGTEETPFEIHLPNELAPYFYIRDYGTGLGHDDVLNLYTTYFDSTKSDSVDATGALGLGSKSPFSMVDDFSVVSYQEGVARTYFAYKNDEGFPCISFISEDTASEERNGIKIQFGVRRDKFADFQNNIHFALYHFDPHPTILNVPVNIIKETILAKGVNGDWEIAANRNQNQRGFYLGDKPVVIMARITYPLDVQQLEHLFDEDDQYLLNVCKVPLRIHVKNRSIDHTPSREHLQYNKKTVNAIRTRLKEIYDEMFAKVKEEFSDCLTLNDVNERAAYLYRLDESNIRVNPWKSKLKVFGPGEFKVFSTIFYSKITLENIDPKTGNTVQLVTNLGNLFQNAGVSSNNDIISTLYLSDGEYYGLNAVTCGSVWGRMEAKSFDMMGSQVLVKSDEELLNHIKDNPGATLEDARAANLINVRSNLSIRKSHSKFGVKLAEKWATTVDCFGNVVAAKTLDRKATAVTFALARKCIDLVLVIDDYPKDISAMIRAGYSRAVSRNYTDYVVFTNTARTGGRFLKDEAIAFEATVRHLGKKLGAKVVRASEIEIPEVFTKVERTKSVMAKNEYCAFNIVHYDQTMDRFVETPADSKKLGEEFSLPGFEDESVIFIRRQYSSFYLSGDEGTGSSLSKEYKLGEAHYSEFEELIRFTSVFAGRDILKGKTVVVIKTKSQYQKAMEKSKWTRFDKFMKGIITKFDQQTLREFVATFMLSHRNGYREIISQYNTSSRKVMREQLKSIDVPHEELVESISAVSGLFASIFSVYDDRYKRLEEAKDEAEIIVKNLPDCELKQILKDGSKFFELNKSLENENCSPFNKFTVKDCGTGYFKNSNVKGLILDHDTICDFFHEILGKKLIVQMFEFIVQSHNAVKKYPLLSLYSSKLTGGENGFSRLNIERSTASIQHFIDYISLVEGK